MLRLDAKVRCIETRATTPTDVARQRYEQHIQGQLKGPSGVYSTGAFPPKSHELQHGYT